MQTSLEQEKQRQRRDSVKFKAFEYESFNPYSFFFRPGTTGSRYSWQSLLTFPPASYNPCVASRRQSVPVTSPPRQAHPGAIAMVAVRAARSVGLSILLAVGAAAAALGQDSAPAELTPQAVLERTTTSSVPARSGCWRRQRKTCSRTWRTRGAKLPASVRGDDAPARAGDWSPDAQGKYPGTP